MELDQLLQRCYETDGSTDAVNKFYVLLFRTNLYLPVTLNPDNQEEPFTPLHIKQGEHFFIPAFSSLQRLNAWAQDQQYHLDHVVILGEALLRNLGSKAYLCLNIGTPYYKEFAPDEIMRLKLIIAKMDKLRNAKPNESQSA